MPWKWTILTLLYRQQTNTENKNPISAIYNAYPQINWSYYSSLNKLVGAISWIKSQNQIVLSGKGGSKQGRTLT